MTTEEESVRLWEPAKVIVDDLRFIHTSENNFVLLFVLIYHIDVRKFWTEILLKFLKLSHESY